MTNALTFLLDTFSRLYLLILLLRFWLPLLRANFRNPVAQGVMRYTSPLVNPVRRYIPSFGRLDTATVLIAFLIQFVVSYLIMSLNAISQGAGTFAALSSVDVIFALAFQSIVQLAMLSVLLFIVAIIVRIVLGLIGRYFGPISDLLVDLTEPLLRPVRKVIPPLGVVDISAYIVIVLLMALNMILADLAPMAR
jgi:YggT family protein